MRLNLRATLAMFILCCLQVQDSARRLCTQAITVEPIDFNESYSPGEWRNPYEPMACIGSATWPRYGAFNDIGFYDQYPIYGYPLRGSTFAGMNDTIQIQINWINYTDNDYVLSGKHPETWFVPRVFRMEDRSLTATPWRDSTDLKYRIRGWKLSRNGAPKSTPDKIPKRMDGGWIMLMDVWNLPQGRFSLCVDTSKDVPDDFIGRTGGDNFEYFACHDLADSIDAYEAIFRRALADSNYYAAKQWIQKMLAADSASVPAWWLNATYYSYVGDTVEVKEAYDKALGYLTANADPAMPDSTKRPLLASERNYVEWCRQRITWERSLYGP